MRVARPSLASLLVAAALACESAGPSGDDLTITVTGEASLIAIGGTVQLTATARDGEGAVIQGLTFEWNTSDPAVATVSSSGLVTGAAGGTALITAGWRGSAGTKSIAVIPAADADVGSVVLTASEPLLAPGETARFEAEVRNALGEPLARKPDWSSETPSVATVDAAGLVLALAPGTTRIFARSDGKEASATLTVAGNVLAIGATEGTARICALSLLGEPWCGNFADALAPVPVPAPLVMLSTGVHYACGLTADGEAICWGTNEDGELGRGTHDGIGGVRHDAAPVSGDLTFREIAAGSQHTCAIAADGSPWCWGENAQGQLGDGTYTRRTVPTSVLGDLDAVRIAVALYVSCAVTSDGAVWCWGTGPLGNDGQAVTNTPLRIASTEVFADVGIGANHACALAVSGQLFCWRATGTPDPTVTPQPAGGAIRFASISVEADLTCGVTMEGATLCSTDWLTIPFAPALSRSAAAVDAGPGALAGGSGSICVRTSGGAAFCSGSLFSAGGGFEPERVPQLE